MRITEILTESSNICPQCGMRSCTCKPGTCKCKPKPGYPKNIDEAANPAQQAAIAKKKEQGVAEGQLNELDLFAPVTTFIKMTNGSYIQADWRKSQGNPGLSDSASFVNFKPVNPNVAKQLGLDSHQRNNSISNHRDGTIVPGGPIQGSGPLANRGYEVVDYNKPETMKELPPEIKSELIKWIQKQGVAEGEVIPMQPRNPLNKNLIIQLKALSETALEIFWEGSYVPTAAQGQMAQLSQQEQNKIFKQNVAQFKALGYETSIFEDDMDILFLHSIAREAWYDSKKPMSKYRGLPDLEYNSDTNSLKIIDLIGDDDKGIVYDKNVYEQDVAGGLNEFSLSNNDGNGDEKSYLLHLASDLSNALYVLKNKQAVKDVKDKIIASGGDVKITWNDDGSFNVVMYHPTYFKQGYLISLVGKGKQQDVDEDWQKVNKKDKTDGMSKKAVSAYRRENPGSKLKTAVTTKPSKLKKGSKDASRRKSFCARMGGMKKAHASAKTKRDPDSPINKALRRWNCESVEQMQELVMIAEQMVRKAKL